MTEEEEELRGMDHAAGAVEGGSLCERVVCLYGGFSNQNLKESVVVVVVVLFTSTWPAVARACGVLVGVARVPPIFRAGNQATVVAQSIPGGDTSGLA